MSKSFDRTIALVGDERFNRLVAAHVLVVGLGGVGGAAVEALVRYGIGEFTFVDGDDFEESNLNRQILCTVHNLGKNKAEEAAIRARSVSPQVKTHVFPQFFNNASADKILATAYDFAVDAIDDLENKVELIYRCKQGGIPVISAMGAGNRLDCTFCIKDLYATSHDYLARATRKLARERGITDVPTVCAAGPALKLNDSTSKVIPSCAAPPIVMGTMMASYVANKLMGL